jgi:hypothetical protein
MEGWHLLDDSIFQHIIKRHTKITDGSDFIYSSTVLHIHAFARTDKLEPERTDTKVH